MVRTKSGARKSVPKKKPRLGEGSSSQPQPPLPQLIDSKALERYNELVAKQFYFERGFNFKDSWKGYEELKARTQQRITTLGWTKFCALYTPGSREVVHEFYANGHGAKGNYRWVTVRGEEVSFYGETINELYSIKKPSLADCHYNDIYLAQDHPEVFRVLCGTEGVWNTGTQGQPTALDKNLLTLEAKLWLYFVCGRILPSEHPKEVTWDRGVIIYCILQNLYIDVGDLISNELLANLTRVPSPRAAHEDSSPKLFYPNMIHLLCVSFGVGIGNDEMRIPNAPRKNFQAYWCNKTIKETHAATSKKSEVAHDSEPLTEGQRGDATRFIMGAMDAQLQAIGCFGQHFGVDLSSVMTPVLPPWYLYPRVPFPYTPGASGSQNQGEVGPQEGDEGDQEDSDEEGEEEDDGGDDPMDP